MQLPKLAIFDMDGLLFDSERILMEENRKVMESYGYTQTCEDYSKTIGMAGDSYFETLFAIYGPDYPAHEIAPLSAQNCVERMMRDGVPVKEGIPELLSFFRDHGVTCCVATSTRRPSALKMLEKADILDAFSYVVTSDEVTNSKPDPSIFLKARASRSSASRTSNSPNRTTPKRRRKLSGQRLTSLLSLIYTK